MHIRLVADGHTSVDGSSLVMHNERLADPLDPVARALGEVTSKRKKTIEDHMEIARREFFGGLYTDPPLPWPIPDNYVGRPALPAWNVLRCLQDGAKRHKRGPDVLRGCAPLTEFAVIEYDGPTDPVAMWQSQAFVLRKSVGVQRSRTMRTRPIFTDWSLRLDIELDLEVFDVNTLSMLWTDAGKYAGLGEMRPVYGRFHATVETNIPAAGSDGNGAGAKRRRRAPARA